MTRTHTHFRTMNKTLFFCLLVGFNSAMTAPAQTAIATNWTVNAIVPEGNPVGLTESQTFAGLPTGLITDVQVRLDITGGYDGGLYGYLVLQDAVGSPVTEILLNQIGTSPANPFGSSAAGLNVTLSDSGTLNGSIHNAPGIPTGLWQPDSSSTLDATFGGLTANGTWTLFLADDIAGAGTSTLQSWGLNVTVAPVPEPGAEALSILAGVTLLAVRRIRHRR